MPVGTASGPGPKIVGSFSVGDFLKDRVSDADGSTSIDCLSLSRG